MLLVRHGATTHTAQRRLSGCTGEDPPLSATGLEQAAALARSLVRDQARTDEAAGPVTAIVSSPVRRAHQTATTLGSALGLPVGLDEDLREIDFGAWEGLTAGQVQDGWPGGLDAWRSTTDQPAPDGESVDDVALRVAAARARLVAAHPGGTVLVVSHLYPVRLSVLDALDAPRRSVHQMLHQPTGVSEVVVTGDRSELVRHNDSGHLR